MKYYFEVDGIAHDEHTGESCPAGVIYNVKNNRDLSIDKNINKIAKMLHVDKSAVHVISKEQYIAASLILGLHLLHHHIQQQYIVRLK